MSWITARRRRPAAGYAVILLGLIGVGFAYAAVSGSGGAPAASPAPAALTTPLGTAAEKQLALGRQLFQVTCASCHGFSAQGTASGPSLIGAGAAAVDFQVSTGRMPAKEMGPEQPRKPAVYDEADTHAIAAYIEALGGGPTIPSASEVNPHGADLALGNNLFITDCAQCHNFSGAGGALTEGKYAPPLTQSTPTQIDEAMETGPEAMPLFAELPQAQKRDIIDYITTVRAEPNPGGMSLGRVGPVTEGLVGFLGGIGILCFCALWITIKRRES